QSHSLLEKLLETDGGYANAKVTALSTGGERLSFYDMFTSVTDSGVTLHAPSFPYAQLNLPNNLAKLKQLTNDFYGKPADFQLEAAQAGAPRPAARSLDDFRNDKFNDVVKFK
ncbi:MAG: hypothetical protein IKB58_01375, partial [Oscillospiraceae bacterium]|nr:hypothetical protein [Oscillospiraceae bacterium]